MTEEKRYLPNEIPETITMPVSIYYTVDGYDAGKVGVYCFDWDGDTEKVILHKTTATFNIPPQEGIKDKVLEALEEEKKKIMAESHMKLQKIQEKIENLLAIEYRPTE